MTALLEFKQKLKGLYAQYEIPRHKGQMLKKVTFREIRKKSL